MILLYICKSYCSTRITITFPIELRVIPFFAQKQKRNLGLIVQVMFGNFPMDKPPGKLTQFSKKHGY